MEDFTDKFKEAIASRPALATVALWNFILFFVAAKLPEVPYLLSLRIPAEVSAPAAGLGVTLMRLFTYTFIHTSAGHLCANMFWLILFGYVIYPRLGALKFLLLYFGGGFAGGLLFIAVAKFGGLIPASGDISLCGASAATLAVAVAAWIMAPRHVFLNPARTFLRKALSVAFLAALAIVLTFICSRSIFAASAHAGGLIAGWLLTRGLRNSGAATSAA